MLLVVNRRHNSRQSVTDKVSDCIDWLLRRSHFPLAHATAVMLRTDIDLPSLLFFLQRSLFCERKAWWWVIQGIARLPATPQLCLSCSLSNLLH